ncbi:MAG: AI-2E family transporter [Bacteroidota bacterium]
MSRLANSLLILIASVFILMEAKSILIPFVIAIIVWFVIKEVKKQIQRIKIRKKQLPHWLSNVISFLVIFGVLSVTISILASNINGIATEIQNNTYDKNVSEIRDQLDRTFGLNISQEVRQFTSSFDFSEVLGDLLNQLTSVFSNAFLVVIYVLFLMLEDRFFGRKIQAFFSNGQDNGNVKNILNKINDSMGKYVTLKSIVSLITGLLSFIALKIIGVDFAFFWAFIIFLMNYIPTVGSLIGTLFPTLAAMLQFGSFHEGLWVLGAVGIIQVLVGNFLEPKMMGNSLNISSLVVILSLSLWGWIWGIVGMLLAVPITVMLIIVFAQIPSTKGIAILLSEKGFIGSSKK